MKRTVDALIRVSSVMLVMIFSIILHGSEPGEVNSVLASVNGQAITLMDVLPLTRNKELQARSVYQGNKLLEVISGYRKKAVDDLIDNILIHQEFAKYKYELPNQDVEREIDNFAVRIGCRSRSQLESRLRKNGSSVNEVRMAIRKNMMVQMMLFRQIRIADPVSPKEAYEYYKNNEVKFRSQEMLKISMFKIDNAAPDYEKHCAGVNDLLKKDPAVFDQLDKKVGNGIGKINSWEVARADLRPEFSAAFKKFATGEISAPVKIYDGTVWLKICAFSPAVQKSFKDVEEQIKAELELKIRENVISVYAAKLRSKALIEYFF